MKSLLFIGTVILLVGVVLTLSGAVYSASYSVGRDYSCGRGCSGSSPQTIVQSHYLYPIWSPQTWSPLNYRATYCVVLPSWYTPFTPPPLCNPPPVEPLATSSANYLVNLVGIVLIVVGFVMMVRGHTTASTLYHPMPNTENEDPKT